MEFPAAAISVAVALFILFASTAVYSAQDFDIASQLRSKSSNAAGLCANVIEPSGFPCTEHTTRTKDGYVLGLQRVTSHSVAVHKGAPPVLLIHGLFMGGDAWFLDSPNQSLGFILANRGYDVWVGNVRGTRWSHGHVSLSEEDKDFWDWSWQELALHDLGEMIHYIYSTTNSEVLVVGHSQGTIMSLAALTQPYIAKMVKAAALLCPISYLDHITAPFVLKLVKMRLDEIILALGIHELNFKSEWGTRIMDMMCDGHLDCADMLSSVTGENCCFNSSRIDSYLEYEPHPSSSKNLHHLFQMIREGTFAMYDYGVWKNLMYYKQWKPPAFDVSSIPSSLPIWMGYGGNDALADVADVQRTIKELVSKPELLYLENYGHIDFLLSTKGKEDVYDSMLSFFSSLAKSSSY
ncbi:triacylglycerol lipase 1-like [Salvia splendens]|uniref:triacylglycerol lipase 1-like n=1 Tax=Salvia splendens TaxID=180675 RepID=UPI001C278998|nr:triacylglycerol lipase 1-like [Salvia splendens]XP_042008439.1 triacylglycerol lipase 1-like [Salvia splendens]